MLLTCNKKLCALWSKFTIFSFNSEILHLKKWKETLRKIRTPSSVQFLEKRNKIKQTTDNWETVPFLPTDNPLVSVFGSVLQACEETLATLGLTRGIPGRLIYELEPEAPKCHCWLLETTVLFVHVYASEKGHIGCIPKNKH